MNIVDQMAVAAKAYDRATTEAVQFAQQYIAAREQATELYRQVVLPERAQLRAIFDAARPYLDAAALAERTVLEPPTIAYVPPPALIAHARIARLEDRVDELEDENAALRQQLRLASVRSTFQGQRLTQMEDFLLDEE